MERKTQLERRKRQDDGDVQQEMISSQRKSRVDSDEDDKCDLPNRSIFWKFGCYSGIHDLGIFKNDPTLSLIIGQ